MHRIIAGLLFIILYPTAVVAEHHNAVLRNDGVFYLDLQLGASAINHSGRDFYPVTGSVGVGAFVLPGIGIDVFADAGLRNGKSGDFDMDIEQAWGVGLRLQSPPQRGAQGYIVLGIVNYTLDQQVSSEEGLDASSVDEEFTGWRASIGVMQRLESVPWLQFTTEYRHYNADEPLRIDALMIGFRVNAR